MEETVDSRLPGFWPPFSFGRELSRDFILSPCVESSDLAIRRGPNPVEAHRKKSGRRGGSSYYPAIAYSFWYQGEVYHSDRVAFGQFNFSDQASSIKALDELIKDDQTVTVFHNSDPRDMQSVLLRGYHFGFVENLIGVLIGLTIVTAGLLYWRHLVKHERASRSSRSNSDD